MKKILKQIIIPILLIFVLSNLVRCSSALNQNDNNNGYIAIYHPMLTRINCDSIHLWFKTKKKYFNQLDVYKKFGIKKENLNWQEAEKQTPIKVQDGNCQIQIKKIIIPVNRYLEYVIYYTKEFNELLFIRYRFDDIPLDTIYLSSNKKTENILCSLVSDSNFILNKMTFVGVKTIIPPVEK